jgi:hypothetical protein
VFRSGRSRKLVVQVRPVRKASCSGQASLEGQLFISGQALRPVFQVRAVLKANFSGPASLEDQFCSGQSGRPVVQVRPDRNASCSDSPQRVFTVYLSIILTYTSMFSPCTVSIWFPKQIQNAFLFPLIHATCLAHFVRYLVTRITFIEQYRS